MLARLCAKGTVQPEINRLVGELTRMLVHEVVAAEFPREPMAVPTRMIDVTPRGVWRGDAIATATPAVVVAVARAGLLPSQVAYDFLNQVLLPEGVRQDHLALARTVDDKGGVTGAGVYGSKIGGPVDGAMLLIPDPMGATGSTISKVIEQYGADTYGRPGKIIAVHLIITPEYLRHVTTKHPEVIVYALRLDRGLSPADVLQTMPGERWARGARAHRQALHRAGRRRPRRSHEQQLRLGARDMDKRIQVQISAEQIAARVRRARQADRRRLRGQGDGARRGA